MALPRDLITQIRRLDQYELRRLLIVVRGLLVAADGPPGAHETDLPPTLRYRQEHVRCGKAGCTTCPHGPYWYAYWKEDGRTRKRYLGRNLPGAADGAEPDAGEATAGELTQGGTAEGEARHPGRQRARE
ncbi:hypothetical protein [Egicoccus sp. AB-alg2]|uniref:hypothetical protein n=1 Tax=Egicoccus sp. AB-alg2 TaxID=3242693 RepID=UPI00359EF797